MSLLKEAGVPTPKFGIAETAAEARKIAEDLGTKDLVIKAQVKLFNLGFHAKKVNKFFNRYLRVVVAKASFPSTPRAAFSFSTVLKKSSLRPKA